MEPSQQPTMVPTQQPSVQPSMLPTQQPSSRPSMEPTTQPSEQPSMQPSSRPSTQPIGQPSCQPSEQPTSNPTRPSSQPTEQPSNQPSSRPSTQPSEQPSRQPSSTPTRPSGQPSSQPTDKPTHFEPNPGYSNDITQSTLAASVGGAIGGAILYVLACLFICRSKPLDGTSEAYKKFREGRLKKIHADDFGNSHCTLPHSLILSYTHPNTSSSSDPPFAPINTRSHLSTTHSINFNPLY